MDKVRYKQLLDGLEAKEVKLSELERTSRMDAEFYKKENADVLKTLKNCKYVNFTDVAYVSDGNHMSISNDFQDGDDAVPYYRGQDIYNFFIENSNPIYISQDAYNRPFMKRSHLKKGDVLLSIVGAIIGNSSLVYQDMQATCSCKLAILRPKKSKILSEVLAIYIKTLYGQNQIQKFRRGASQTGLLLEDMNQLLIPEFSSDFQEKIKEMVCEAHAMEENSQNQYSDAEAILLNMVGMKDFKENEEKVAVKFFTESFGVSGRIDAEYYQKKYDDLFEILEKSNSKRLVEIADIKKSVEPGSSFYREDGTSFIRVANLSKYEITKTDIYLNEDNFAKGYLLKPKKDTILLSKDGSVGIAYKVDKDENFITSGAILHLTVKDSVLPDYLTLVLNSKITSLQAEKDAGGSIIRHWKPSEIEQVIIPILSIEVQRELSEKIKESFELRQQSKTMLNKAKRALEIVIEQSEEEAIKYLYTTKLLTCYTQKKV